MVWYKAWLDTRWRFLIGLGVMTCAAVAAVAAYPSIAAQVPLIDAMQPGEGALAREIRAGAEAAREFRGYVWWQWFRQSFRETWTLFAVLLGTGGLVAQTSGRGTLYTLSLPVSRRSLLGTRAATALGELFVLALVPALMIPLAAPAIGRSYPFTDALVHGLCLFTAGSVFFSLAFLLSTVFADVWRPSLIALMAAYGLTFAGLVSRDAGRFGILRVMSAQPFYQSGTVPWLGLLVTAALSAAMLYAAMVNLSKRDF